MRKKVHIEKMSTYLHELIFVVFHYAIKLLCSKVSFDFFTIWGAHEHTSLNNILANEKFYAFWKSYVRILCNSYVIRTMTSSRARWALDGLRFSSAKHSWTISFSERVCFFLIDSRLCMGLLINDSVTLWLRYP